MQSRLPGRRFRTLEAVDVDFGIEVDCAPKFSPVVSVRFVPRRITAGSGVVTCSRPRNRERKNFHNSDVCLQVGRWPTGPAR